MTNPTRARSHLSVCFVRWLGLILLPAFALFAAAADELRAEIVTVMKEQIDMVHAIGLPLKIMQDLQTVPIAVIHAYSIGPGRYGPAKGVEMASMVVAVRKRPVLIHELMHAFHDRYLPGGVRNRDVLNWHEAAKAAALYGEKPYMVSTVGEFFACSTTTYLAGATAQEPFRRATLKEKQPEWYAYMQKLFGEDAGKHDGQQAPVDVKRLQEMRQKYPETNPPAKQKKKQAP